MWPTTSIVIRLLRATLNPAPTTPASEVAHSRAATECVEKKRLEAGCLMRLAPRSYTTAKLGVTNTPISTLITNPAWSPWHSAHWSSPPPSPAATIKNVELLAGPPDLAVSSPPVFVASTLFESGEVSRRRGACRQGPNLTAHSSSAEAARPLRYLEPKREARLLQARRVWPASQSRRLGLCARGSLVPDLWKAALVLPRRSCPMRL